jgi:predicted glycosyltransferase
MAYARACEAISRRAISASRSAETVRVWIDIENPPQVQYLLPFRRAFERVGVETVVTARDYGPTLEMLARSDVHAHAFGARVAGGTMRKILASCLRARSLSRFFARTGSPDAAVSASRAAALAAWRMGIPSFMMFDYEHANASVLRLAGATVMYPDVIDPAVFHRRGAQAPKLYPFRGIKEDLTFAGVDVDEVEAYDIGPAAPDAVRVLFRPPSETSHYYRVASTRLTLATLEYLAAADALVIFAPRERTQVEMLVGLPWRHEPIVLERPAPFVPLLKSVDLVISSGGTMLREGAYLGVPSYSIFQSEIGAVDRWLEQVGRAKLLASESDLRKIELRKRGPLHRLNSNPELLDELIDLIAGAAANRRVLGRDAAFGDV